MTLRLGREALFHFLSQIGVTVAGFFASLTIARVGGADTVGLYAAVVAIMFWVNVPATGISDALTKRLTETNHSASFLATGWVIELALATTIALVIIATGPFLQEHTSVPVGPPLAVLIVCNTGLISILGTLKGQKKVAISGGVKTTERILRSVLHIMIILLGYRVSALIIGHAASMLIATLIGIYFTRLRITQPSVTTIRSLLNYAQYAWLSKLKTRAFGWMDTIVLVLFSVSPGIIGIYEVAWNIASVFALLSISVQTTLFPEMSELSVNQEQNQIHHLLNEGLTFTGLILIPGFFGSIILGGQILEIYGSEFTQGVSILSVLVLARLMTAYGDQLLNVANGIDRPDVSFRVNTVFVVSNISLNIGLVAIFGWKGAAAATMISGTLVALLGYLSLAEIIGRPNIPWAELLKQLGGSVLMVCAVLLLQQYLSESYYTTVVLVMVGAGVYTLVLITVSKRIRAKAIHLSPI